MNIYNLSIVFRPKGKVQVKDVGSVQVKKELISIK